MSDFYKDFDISVSQSVCHQPASMADVLRSRSYSLCHATISFSEKHSLLLGQFSTGQQPSGSSVLLYPSCPENPSVSPEHRHHRIGESYSLGDSKINVGLFPGLHHRLILVFHTARNKAVAGTWERVLFHVPFTVARSDMPNLPPPDRDLRSSYPLGQRGCTSGHSWRFGSAEIKSEREYIRQERTLTLLPHHQ